MASKLEGLIAAPFTAFQADGSLNLKVIDRQAEQLIATGVRGAFVCGTTGEGSSLSTNERQAVAARWVEVAGRDLTIIVHTGHNSLAESKALAVHAQEIGAHATAAMPPCFFKPARVAELVDSVAEIAAAAPELPFYYYHIPVMTGVSHPMAQFLAEAADVIPNLAGVKFTHENLMDYCQAAAVNNGQFDILFGRDEILLCGLALGARGAVGSTYNYSASLYQRLITAFAAGEIDQARQHQAKVVQFIELLVKYGGLPAGKAKMKMIGIDCGPCRLPLRTLSAELYQRLQVELDGAGFFDQIKPAGAGIGSGASRLVYQR